jgi:hypothetical protein
VAITGVHLGGNGESGKRCLVHGELEKKKRGHLGGRWVGIGHSAARGSRR